MALSTIDTSSIGGLGYGFKNRIINGGMVIDQRNNGAAITVNTSGAQFSCDRWYCQGQSADGVFTVQQSSTAPTGFTKSMLLTVTTADSSIGATQTYFYKQAIEGYNMADLAWGTASAQSVTLSFWVRSSLTGTFSGAVNNGGFTRGYPFTFTINAANTWEQKTVTIAGDTTGTWATDNSAGMNIYFAVGSGSTYLGTANTWAATGYVGATGQTNLIATNGATFYITGVQLEKGTVATSFDWRPYGTELALCQRYYQVVNFVSGDTGIIGACVTTDTVRGAGYFFPQTMRAAPTVTLPAAGKTAGLIAFLTSGAGYPVTVGSHNVTSAPSSFVMGCTGYTSAFTAGNTSILYSQGASTGSLSSEL